MKKTTVNIMLIIVAIMAMASITSAQTKKETKPQQMKPEKAGNMILSTKSSIDLRMNMRKLWEDHIVYTRNYIISAVAGLEDEGMIAERLLRNQDDIGNAIVTFYGKEAGDKLSSLLRDHILIAADIVKSAKAGDDDSVKIKDKIWHENSDAIATFLSSANPNWSKMMLVEMLYKHLDLTSAEVVSRIKKDWAADIDAYDKGHEHMLMFSDELTEGIVKQFPEKFRK